MPSSLINITGIMVAAWLLILLGSVIIFFGIGPLPNFQPSREGAVATGIIKVFFSVLLVTAWILILYRMITHYAGRRLRGFADKPT